MPHTLADIVTGDLRLVSEVCGTLFTVAPADLQTFPHARLSDDPVVGAMPAAGNNVSVAVANSAIYADGEFVEVVVPLNPTLRDFTFVVSKPDPTHVILRKIVTNFGVSAASLYQLEMFYDMLAVIDPNPLCTEITTLSLYGSWRDQTVFRKVWAAMDQVAFDRMAFVLDVLPLGAGTREEQIAEIYDKLTARKASSKSAEGAGTFNPGNNILDGGAFVSFANGTFEDQFEDFAGTATFDAYSFEIPFDCFLTRASIVTMTSAVADAYVTILKNDVTAIVDAGPVPPNRNLPAVTGELKGLDLANVPVIQGDKITVKLNLVAANTIHRAKVVIAYAAKLKNL